GRGADDAPALDVQRGGAGTALAQGGDRGGLAEQPLAAAVVPAELARRIDAELAGRLPVDLPAERGRLVHDQAAQPGPGRLGGRGDTRRAAADDDQRPLRRWRATRCSGGAVHRAPPESAGPASPLPACPPPPTRARPGGRQVRPPAPPPTPMPPPNHNPTPHSTPRRSPRLGVTRRPRRPAASNAAATLSPSNAG